MSQQRKSLDSAIQRRVSNESSLDDIMYGGGLDSDVFAELASLDSGASTEVREVVVERVEYVEVAAPSKFAISESRLKIVGKVTEQDVIDKIREVVETQKADYWALGDLIAFMQDQEWGTTYQQLSEITGKAVQTLTDYVWVARAIHFSFRKEKGMTLNHFKAIAPFVPAEQEQWINRVQESKWSVAQLKLAIEGHNIPAAPDARERGWAKVRGAVESAIKADSTVSKADVAAWLRALADELENGAY